jgi:hypothetical protein
MAKQTINIGSAPNSGNGDVIRVAFTKVNDNFTELYARSVFSGSYNDLTNKPTIPTDVSQLTDTTNLLGSGGGNANTGNIQFRNDSMSSLTGVIITNADQTTAGTASITIPANDAASAISIANNNNIWSFTNDGKLQLPSGGDIVNGLGNSVLDNLGYYKIQGNTIGTQGVDENSWGSHAISIDPGGESWAGIYIPELLSQDGYGSLNIYNNKNANNTINLSVYQGNYTFSPTKLTAPASIELKNNIKIEASDLNDLYDAYQGNLFTLEGAFAGANYTGQGYPASKNSYQQLVRAKAINPLIPDSWIPIAKTLEDSYYSWASATANLTASASGFYIENGDGVGWRFDEATGLQFPDGTRQRTAWSGVAPIARKVRAPDQATIEVTSTGNPDKVWDFGVNGTLTTPLGFPRSFTAVLDSDHMIDAVGFTDVPWEYNVQFQVGPNGDIQTMIDNTPHPSNPGYVAGYTFEFSEADHGIPDYTFTITLTDVIHPNEFVYTSNIAVSQPPTYNPTIKSQGAIKLTADTSNWTFGTTGNLTLPTGGDIVDSTGNSVLGGSRVKLQSPGDRRIEEVYGYKEVSVTEVVLGTPVSAIVHSSNTEYWQFYVYSSEELMTLYNSGSGAYVMEVSVDQNNWISAYIGGYNGLDAMQIVLNNGATLQVYDNDTIYYRINTGGEPVVWWDRNELPGGGADFRGATIDYHAFTGESTIIGTIHIVRDDGEDHISHTEVQSGSSDGENDDLWLVTTEGQIQYRRIDKEAKTLKVQWSAKVFYGSELYD